MARVRLAAVWVVLWALLVGVVPGEALADGSRGGGGLLSEAEASLLAMRSGAAVEVTMLTSETRLVTARPDGSFSSEVSVEPRRVRSGGEWRPLDRGLALDSGGRLSAVAGVSDSSVSAGGSGALVRVEDGDRFFELRWVRPLPVPSVEGETAVYREVMPGVDLVAVSGIQGFGTYFVVKSAQAARSLDVSLLRFRWVASPGLKVMALATGIRVVDASGEVVFGSPSLAMWDSSDVPVGARDSLGVVRRGGEGRRRSIGVDVSELEVVLKPDLSLLSSPSTVWPVVIDPSLSKTPKYWSMVWSDGQSFWNSATEHARVGYDGWSGQSKISRVFYRFELGNYVGKTITSATMVHRQIHSPQFSCRVKSFGPRVEAWRTNEFGSGTIWSAQPSALEFQSASGYSSGNSTTCAGSDQEWDVSKGVRAVQSSTSVLSVMLKSESESNRDGWRQYDNIAGTAPRVVVDYRSTPSTGAPSVTAAGDAQSPFISRALTLRASISTPDGGAVVRAKFRVTGPGGWSRSVYGQDVSRAGVSVAALTVTADGRFLVYVQACTVTVPELCSATIHIGFDVDTVPPPPPKVSGASAVMSGESWSALIAAGAGDRVEVSTGGSWAAVSGSTWVWSTPPVGVHQVRFRAVDAAGNRSTDDVVHWFKVVGLSPALAHHYTFDEPTRRGQDTGESSSRAHLGAHGVSDENFPGVAIGSCLPSSVATFPGVGQRLYADVGGGAGAPTVVTETEFSVVVSVRATAGDRARSFEGFVPLVWLAGEHGRVVYFGMQDGRWAVQVPTADGLGVATIMSSGTLQVDDDPNGPGGLPPWVRMAYTFKPGLNAATGTGKFYVDGNQAGFRADVARAKVRYVGVGSVSPSLTGGSSLVDNLRIFEGGYSSHEIGQENGCGR